jgi:FkbM family methyltransferase
LKSCSSSSYGCTCNALKTHQKSKISKSDRAPLSLAELYGLARSLLLYYAIPGRARAWRRFYTRFVQPGELAFDIGAHLGNRSRALLASGARVLAVEPQMSCLRVLNTLYGRNPKFTLLASALAARPAELELLVSRRNPTVSTLSSAWVEQVGQDPGFARVQWDARQPVTAVTLDMLLDEFGLPAFCKLDIEGYELEALKGLSHAIPALSFEYIPAAMDVALGCLDRLSDLGAYRFNLVHSEYPRLALDQWVGAAETKSVLYSIPSSARAGEVYAQLERR